MEDGKRKTENPSSVYPLFVDLRGAKVLVVGGGSVAARKVPALLEAGAIVTVVAPDVDVSIGASGKNLRILRRGFRVSDIQKQKLVFAATSNTKLNQRIAAAAKRARILVNVAAPPEAGDVQIPSVVRRGSMCVAVSTGGASAALAAAWRRKLEAIIGPEWSEWVAELERLRARILCDIPNERARRAVLLDLGRLRWARAVKTQGLSQVRREVDARILKAARKAR